MGEIFFRFFFKKLTSKIIIFSGEITRETIFERAKDTLRMSIYNSFITVKYNRLASPLENAPQASFHAEV